MARLPKDPYWREKELAIREEMYWIRVEQNFQEALKLSRGLGGSYVATKLGGYFGGGTDKFREQDGNFFPNDNDE